MSKSALDLAKATSSSTAANSTNGKKRTRNSQQYRQVKIFAKGQGRPHSQPIRRSNRLINEKRYKQQCLLSSIFLICFLDMSYTI